MKKNIPFNIEDIEKLANSKSFERGEYYYESGAVKKITRSGSHFEAKVRGSEFYFVSLDIVDEELDFDCTCPYDFDGICKHCVALGLAILDGDFTEVADTKQNINTFNPKKFAQCFSEADSQQKLNFLKQLLDKDTDLQAQFVAFIESRSGKLDVIAGVDIDKIAKEIFNDLSNLDFDEAIEESDAYEQGWDTGEEEGAYELVTETLKTYFNRVSEFLKKGNLLDAFRIMLGMYEGANELEEPECQYDIFPDNYDEYVLGEIHSLLSQFSTELEKVVKSDESIQQLIDFYFVRHNKKQTKSIKTFQYDSKYFESFFLSILTNQQIADYLHDKLIENKVNNQSTAFVVLKIAEITENEKLWFDTSEKYAEFEKDIAQNLLKKYKNRNMTDDFNRIAHIAFSNWKDVFDNYLVENLDKNVQSNLFVDALMNLTKRQHKIEQYKELREYLTESQRNTFIAEQKQSYNEVFYIEMLEVEKRYDKILAYITSDKYHYNLVKIITPILNIYPNESYEILKTNCDTALNSLKRNRDTYQYMVKLMATMKNIETKQAESKLYFNILFNNRLPALKDEMKKAKLV